MVNSLVPNDGLLIHIHTTGSRRREAGSHAGEKGLLENFNRKSGQKFMIPHQCLLRAVVCQKIETHSQVGKETARAGVSWEHLQAKSTQILICGPPNRCCNGNRICRRWISLPGAKSCTSIRGLNSKILQNLVIQKTWINILQDSTLLNRSSNPWK